MKRRNNQFHFISAEVAGRTEREHEMATVGTHNSQHTGLDVKEEGLSVQPAVHA